MRINHRLLEEMTRFKKIGKHENISEFLALLKFNDANPPEMVRVVYGLSGGVDMVEYLAGCVVDKEALRIGPEAESLR